MASRSAQTPLHLSLAISSDDDSEPDISIDQYNGSQPLYEQFSELDLNTRRNVGTLSTAHGIAHSIEEMRNEVYGESDPPANVDDFWKNQPVSEFRLHALYCKD
jgi:hypothetical protein